MKKLVFLTGMAVGYVLGSRAGRKRYEQIRSAAQKLWQTESVQSSVNQAEEFAKDRMGDVADSVYSGVKKLVSQAMGSKSTGSKSTLTGKQSWRSNSGDSSGPPYPTPKSGDMPHNQSASS